MDRDADDVDDALLARRRKRAAARRRRIILFSVVGLLAAGVVVLAVRPFAPAAFGPRDDWTHAELYDHLRGRGVKAVMVPRSTGNANRPPLVYFVFSGAKDDPATVAMFADQTDLPCGVVRCEKRADAGQARDAAGVMPDRAFAWGRFLFWCARDDVPHLDAIHKAVYGRPFRK